ncbi:MAG: hypothetical protein FIB07_06370 [Candidatus Methanoperedens sp.]|nr:hypothetical protein [Candidatus Methanoperedens sp.]
MAELKVNIPEELWRKMASFELDWNVVTRDLLKKKVNELSELKSIVSKSKMNEEDALELGRKVNRSLAKRFKDSAIE